MLHLHARNPHDGSPTPSAEVFMPFLPRIKQGSDAVLNITTGGSLGMSMEDRLAAPPRAKPELCSLNMGSMNVGIDKVAQRIADWKHPWERAYVERTRDTIVSNTFAQIERFIRELGHQHGTRFECECHALGHLYTLAEFVDQQLLTPPLFVQTIVGVLGGIGPDPEDLTHLRRTCDRLFGREGYHWSVLAAGRHQIRLARIGAAMGSHVRAALEDSIHLGPGRLARSNAEQVRKIRTIIGRSTWKWRHRPKRAPCWR